MIRIFFGDEFLPSYIGIKISKDKNPMSFIRLSSQLLATLEALTTTGEVFAFGLNSASPVAAARGLTQNLPRVGETSLVIKGVITVITVITFYNPYKWPKMIWVS